MSIMTGSTGVQVNGTTQALYSCLDLTGRQIINNSITARVAAVDLPADAAASTTGTFPGFVALQNYAVRSITYTPSAAVTFNASTFATLTVNQGPAAGGTQLPIGAINTSAISLVALSANVLTLTAA